MPTKYLKLKRNKNIKEYSNATEASKILNIKYYTIHNILSGKTKKCREYPNKLWIYSD